MIFLRISFIAVAKVRSQEETEPVLTNRERCKQTKLALTTLSAIALVDPYATSHFGR